MRVIVVFLTLILGVLIEYIYLIYTSNVVGKYLDVLFLFSMLVIPGLYIYVIPLSLYIEKIRKYRIIISIFIYAILGASIATFIILMAVPTHLNLGLLHKEYLFTILNGSWFSVLYFLIAEFIQTIKKAIQVKNSDSQKFYS